MTGGLTKLCKEHIEDDAVSKTWCRKEENRMNGSIKKRGKGRWELTVDLRQDAAGKRIRKYSNVKGTNGEAQKKLRELLTSLDKGMPIDTSKSP